MLPVRRGLVVLGLIAFVKVEIALGAATAPPVGTPTVTGPRSTTSLQPVYRFHAAHAVSFRCAFDSRSLHFCPSRYSVQLAPGKHTLRVRAVGKRGSSRVVAVKVSVTVPYPVLTAAAPVQVGKGAGFPDSATATGGSVWSASDAGGTITRIDPATGAITATIAAGTRPGGLVAGD